MRARTTPRSHLARLAAVVVLACVLALGPLPPNACGADPAGPRSAVVIALVVLIGNCSIPLAILAGYVPK